MHKSSKTTVVARNLSKSYFLNKQGSQFNLFGHKRVDEVQALKPISFRAQTGESIGLVGQNGSGKSTLLRLISGAESPTSGDAFVSSVPTLLGVSSALQNDLPGKANIRLGLLAMGLSPDEVAALSPEVAEWSEIGEAINRPLKTYSSGMRARLVFSISTSVRREILLIDEALSTGDSAFADRAKERMENLLAESGTVFIVSHGAGTIKDHCSRAIWLNEGEVISDSEAGTVTKNYVRWSKMRARGQLKNASQFLEELKENYRSPVILFDNEAAKALERPNGNVLVRNSKRGKHSL